MRKLLPDALRPRPSRPGCNRTLARAGSDMRDLAIPQLLLSKACAIVLTMKASPTAVFPHRGFAPHQFTPMSGAHKALHRTAICACDLPWGFSFIRQFRGGR